MTDLITADEAQKLLDEATPGPWEACGEVWSRKIYTDGENRVCFMAHSNGLDDDRDIATSELVAAAPDLARTVIALHAELAQARAVLVDAGVKGFPAPVLPPPNCEEQAAQGKRCGCGGSNEMCVCQNVPDRETLRSRAETEASMLEGDEPEHDHRAGE